MEELKLHQVATKSSRDIIYRPLITEKSMNNATKSKYTFEVDPGANKIEIRKAIEDIFKVTVTKVNTSKLPGKRRVRFDKRGRHIGYTKTRKKAVVTLKAGDVIEIGGLNPFEM
ncbi:MAG: 50S ribosomal protein L23 [Firmicutes bacterium]|nr:50S ribosomal protein L23 [Bacillota bacterium]